MAKNDFQYGGWNSYTLQCGMRLFWQAVNILKPRNLRFFVIQVLLLLSLRGSAILKIDMTSFRRLVHKTNTTSVSETSAVIWSKSKPNVEFQYGGCLGEFDGMSSQSHISHCRVLPLGEFTVMIPQPHATLQGVRIPSAILKIVFRHILFYFCF